MAISFVNRVDIFASAGGLDPAVWPTAATNHTAGNLLVVAVMTQGDGASLTITDTAGDTFLAAGSVVTNNANRVWIYYTLSTIGNANNVVQVSVGNSGLNTYHASAVLQFSTDSPPFSLADNDGDTGNSTTASTPALTLTTGAGVAVAVAENDGQGQIAAGGATLHIIADGLGGFTAYQYEVVSSSDSPSMTCGSGPWRMKSALFTDSEGGSPTVVLLGQGVM